MTHLNIIPYRDNETGQRLLRDPGDDAILWLITFDIGVGSLRPETVAAVRAKDYPDCLEGHLEIDEAYTPDLIDPDHVPVYAPENIRGMLPAVKIRAAPPYNDPIVADRDQLTALVDWLDTHLTAVTRRDHHHWRKQPGAYSDHCYGVIELNAEELERQRQRFEFFYAAYKPDADLTNTGQCARCRNKGVWIAGAAAYLCDRHQDDY